MTFSWTPEISALARQLYVTEGLAAQRVAEIIGAPSRNSVIGRAHRQGWTAERGPEARAFNHSRGKEAAAAARRAWWEARQKQKPPKPEKARPMPQHHENPITLLQLRAHTCRWPVGGEGADMIFCGSHAAGVYCSHHAEMAYTKSNLGVRDLARSVRRYAG